MRPEGIMDKISSVRYQDIDFHSHPSFSAHYLVSGPDEEAVRRTFSAQVLSYLQGSSGLNVVAPGDTLITYREMQPLRPEDLQIHFAVGMALFKLLLA
jgi:hypothetical protein